MKFFDYNKLYHMKIEVNLNEIKELSINQLKDVIKIFNNKGINCWLDQGTLLGAIRDNDFLLWDDDIDLGIWKEDINQYPQIWNSFQESGYYVFHRKKLQAIRIETMSPDIGWRSIDINIYHKEGLDAVKYFEKRLDNKLSFILNKIFQFLDHIHFIKNGPDLRYKNISEQILHQNDSNNTEMILINMDDNRDKIFYSILSIIYKILFPKKVIQFFKHLIAQLKLYTCIEVITLKTPISFFKKLSNYRFLGINTLVPSPVNDYLCFKYGNDWKIPKTEDEWVFYQDDGAIEH